MESIKDEEVDPFTNPALDMTLEPRKLNWVGVRTYKKVNLQSKRAVNSCQISIGKVKNVDATTGLANVYVYKEVVPGRFLPCKDDIGLSIPRKDMVVLSKPIYAYIKEANQIGYIFEPKDIKEIVRAYFSYM